MCGRDQGKLQYVWVICPYHYVIWTDEITSIAKNKSFASGAKSRSSSAFVDIESSGFCLLRILKESFINFFHKDNYFFWENVGLIVFLSNTFSYKYHSIFLFHQRWSPSYLQSETELSCNIGYIGYWMHRRSFCLSAHARQAYRFLSAFSMCKKISFQFWRRTYFRRHLVVARYSSIFLSISSLCCLNCPSLMSFRRYL